MKIKYRIVKRKNPKSTGTSDQFVYSGAPIVYSCISRNELLDYVASSCLIDRSEIEAVMSALVTEIQNMVLSGHSVTLPGLGTFQLRVAYDYEDTAAAVVASDLSVRTVGFRRSSEIRHMMDPKLIEWEKIVED